MLHWIHNLLPKNREAKALAEQIEGADERIANLKEQLLAVMARRKELEQVARDLALEALDDDESKLAKDIQAYSEPVFLASCSVSATILHTDLLRLFVDASPFLGELAQGEMKKAKAIELNLERWELNLERSKPCL